MCQEQGKDYMSIHISYSKGRGEQARIYSFVVNRNKLKEEMRLCESLNTVI